MRTIDDIINMMPDMSGKKDRRNEKQARKQIKGDRKEFKEQKRTALDRIMDPVGDSVIKVSENNSDEEEEYGDVGDREIVHIEQEYGEQTNIPDEPSEEEAYEEWDETKYYLPKYYINEKDRIAIKDPYIGVQTFSTMAEGTDESFDADVLGSLSVVTLLQLESTHTPYFIANRSTVTSALNKVGITDYDRTKFILIDPLKGHMIDSQCLGFYVPDEIYNQWNEIIDELVDNMKSSAVVEILTGMVDASLRTSFSECVSELEYSAIIKTDEFRNLQEFVDIMASDSGTKFENEMTEDIFVDKEEFIREIAGIFGYEPEEESEGASNDDAPFLADAESPGQGTDGHGGSDGGSDDSSGQSGEEMEEESKEKEEDVTSLQGNVEDELSKAFEEMQ